MKYILRAALAALALVACVQSRADENQAGNPSTNVSTNGVPSPGRGLFLKNCAHCHGADAHGDEGPDLHALDWTDAQIAKRIRNGKSGQMTAFDGKLATAQINQLIAYVRTLK